MNVSVSPFASQTRLSRPNPKPSKLKIMSISLEDDDFDDDENNSTSTHLVGKGQATATKRFEKLKGKISTEFVGEAHWKGFFLPGKLESELQSVKSMATKREPTSSSAVFVSPRKKRISERAPITRLRSKRKPSGGSSCSSTTVSWMFILLFKAHLLLERKKNGRFVLQWLGTSCVLVA